MGRRKHRFPTVRMLFALLLVGAVAACRGDDDRADDTQPPDVPEAPAATDHAPAGTSGESGEAFTFADDELCDWITADEVAGFFASVYDWDVAAEVPDTDDQGSDECWWRLNSTSSSEFYEVRAGNADPGVVLPVEEVVEFGGESIGGPGGTVSGHPALGEGVVVQNAGWGWYTFWVPPADDYVSLSLTRHTAPGDAGVVEGARMEAQARLFAFADEILRELGWVS